MADIFDEIEEDLKRDRLDKAWKKYGNYVIAVAILIVAATAGNTLWDSYQKGRMVEQANAFDAALVTARGGDVDGAVAALDGFAAGSDAGYRLMARLQQASLLVEQEKVADAIAIYDGIAADDSIDPVYQGLGLVLSVMHAADSGEADTMLARLAPQLEAGAPWRFTALELAAGLSLRKGDKNQAISHLKTVVDAAEAPEGARRRATELLRSLEG